MILRRANRAEALADRQNPRKPYSYRKAIIGSTRMARRAGR